MTIATRAFSPWCYAVSFGNNGSYSPRPAMVNRSGEIPAFIKYLPTDNARPSESSQLVGYSALVEGLLLLCPTNRTLLSMGRNISAIVSRTGYDSGGRSA